MSTSLGVAPAPGRAPRRYWWLAPEVAAALIVLALLVFGVGAPKSGGDLHTAAGDRAARALEQASPAEHHGHGHAVAAEDRVFCGVAVFGVDPPSAAAIDDVRTVYGYYFCAMGRPGLSYLDSSRSDGPIVVSLAGPPTIQIVAPGIDYQERVRAMMPDQYEDLCFGGLPDPAVAEEVKRRYELGLT